MKGSSVWLVVVFFSVLVAFAFSQSSIVNKSPSNTVLNTEYMKWATIDVKPAVGFHSQAPVRIRVDAVESIAGFITSFPGMIDKSGGYAAGVTSIHIDNIPQSGLPKVGQTFSIPGTGKIYTVTALSAWVAPGDLDVTFTPGLGAAVADDVKVNFRTYFTQVNTSMGCYYDEREVHVLNGVLAGLGWGAGSMSRYEMPPE